jgi:soluble lytic murein transglycosylase-like protein
MFEPVRKALFPGVLIGILCIFGMANLAVAPNRAIASTTTPAQVEVAIVLQSPVKTSESKSALDTILDLFVPIILRAEAILPLPPASTPDPAPKPAAVEHSSTSQNCAVSEVFSENVRRWCDLITRSAAESGLDANLIAAVMTVESGGNPDAYSHSGAVGLMQVMPRDGIAASFSCINGPCFARRPSMAELYDPAYNLEYASNMLAGLVSKHGNVRDALHAYGPAGAGYSYADKVLGLYERNR